MTDMRSVQLQSSLDGLTVALLLALGALSNAKFACHCNTRSASTILSSLPVHPLQVPELNVQNGVLKALSFLFEYIGEMGKDYIYAVSPLLEDALIDRDLVHRQTAASVVQHMSLGVAGLGCEDGLTHLLNLVWPNIFEMSPHVVNAVMGAIDGCRLALGPPIILNYTLQVS